MEAPPLVQRYLDRALPAGLGMPRRVRLAQVGEMRQRRGWLRFRALEEFEVQEVAFSWSARFRLLSLLPLLVVDRYADGVGLLEARLLGLIRVMREGGPDVSRAEALRYLAELAWVPHAMFDNRQLEWRELDARTVEVGTQVGDAGVALRLEFDAAGDIVGAACDARPRAEGSEVVPTPWAGSFSGHSVLGGIRIPTRAEARWELADGPQPYWRGTVTDLQLV